MNNQLKKLVADFGGTHLRIGLSKGLEINKISKIRYDNEASSIQLILKTLIKLEYVPLDRLKIRK